MRRLAEFLFPKRAAPTSPPAGFSDLYVKNDGRFYTKDEAGVESVVGVVVGNTNPNLTGPGLWIQTGLGPGGTGFTFWFEDGA